MDDLTLPLVSVVISSYNNHETIVETLESVLSQEGVEFEVILADHSSDDLLREALGDLIRNSRLKIMPKGNNEGMRNNWNRVTREARGRYVKLVAADDLLKPGTLARQALLLEETGAVLTACEREIIDGQGNVLMARWGLRGLGKNPIPGSKAIRRSIRAGTNIFGEPVAVTMNREALETANFWHEGFPYFLDHATYVNVLALGDFVPDNHVGASFRVSEKQLSSELLKEQLRQGKKFHRWLRSEHRQIVSWPDVAVGRILATGLWWARRLFYLLLHLRGS